MFVHNKLLDQHAVTRVNAADCPLKGIVIYFLLSELVLGVLLMTYIGGYEQYQKLVFPDIVVFVLVAEHARKEKCYWYVVLKKILCDFGANTSKCRNMCK